PSIKARIGLEISYRPEREQEIRELLRCYDFDFLIGSIHHIDDWMFDHPSYFSGYALWDVSELYQAYFGLVERMVLSGLFDVVGHLDLVKVFDVRPMEDVRGYAEASLKAIARSKMVIEVNTAGLYKPCKEIYPARELLEKCYTMNIPVTLGSDAHEPEEVARGFSLAREILYDVGYRKLTRFVGRQRIYEYF
ncbi:MAG: histidinol-phosphatase HisJ family protein, partial [Thermacetogeniaceae bacterium]